MYLHVCKTEDTLRITAVVRVGFKSHQQIGIYYNGIEIHSRSKRLIGCMSWHPGPTNWPWSPVVQDYWVLGAIGVESDFSHFTGGCVCLPICLEVDLILGGAMECPGLPT